MFKKEFQELANKWMNNIMTDQERMLLDKWYDQEPEAQVFWSGNDKSDTELKKRLYNKIMQHVNHKPIIRKLFPCHIK